MKKALKKKGQAQERPLKKSVDKAKPLEDINILLLGPSYDGFDERVAARNRIVEVIYNFLKDTRKIVEPVISPGLRDQAEADFQQPSTTVHHPEAFPKDLLISLKELWSDQGVRNGCMRCIVDGRKPSISYFLDSMDRIVGSEYTPNDEDVTRALFAQQEGFEEFTMFAGQSQYHVIDGFGIAMSTKKPPVRLAVLDATIFMANLFLYDEVPPQAGESNRVIDTLKRFDEFCQREWLSEVPTIFFRHTKALGEKVATKPLNEYLPRYKGNSDLESVLAYISKGFLSLNPSKNQKKFTPYF